MKTQRLRFVRRSCLGLYDIVDTEILPNLSELGLASVAGRTIACGVDLVDRIDTASAWMAGCGLTCEHIQ